MGVHNLAVYPQVKELLEVPSDEPIFIFRAQDMLYTPVLGVYEQMYLAAIWSKERGALGDVTGPKMPEVARQFADHIDACRDNGRRWQTKNRQKVKVPDA